MRCECGAQLKPVDCLRCHGLGGEADWQCNVCLGRGEVYRCPKCDGPEESKGDKDMRKQVIDEAADACPRCGHFDCRCGCDPQTGEGCICPKEDVEMKRDSSIADIAAEITEDPDVYSEQPPGPTEMPGDAGEAPKPWGGPEGQPEGPPEEAEAEEMSICVGHPDEWQEYVDEVSEAARGVVEDPDVGLVVKFMGTEEDKERAMAALEEKGIKVIRPEEEEAGEGEEEAGAPAEPGLPVPEPAGGALGGAPGGPLGGAELGG